jgi:hypothetical protein
MGFICKSDAPDKLVSILRNLGSAHHVILRDACGAD